MFAPCASTSIQVSVFLSSYLNFLKSLPLLSLTLTLSLSLYFSFFQTQWTCRALLAITASASLALVRLHSIFFFDLFIFLSIFFHFTSFSVIFSKFLHRLKYFQNSTFIPSLLSISSPFFPFLIQTHWWWRRTARRPSLAPSATKSRNSKVSLSFSHTHSHTNISRTHSRIHTLLPSGDVSNRYNLTRNDSLRHPLSLSLHLWSDDDGPPSREFGVFVSVLRIRL